MRNHETSVSERMTKAIPILSRPSSPIQRRSHRSKPFVAATPVDLDCVVMAGSAYATACVRRHCKISCAGKLTGGLPSIPIVGVQPARATCAAQLSAVVNPPASVNVVSRTLSAPAATRSCDDDDANDGSGSEKTDIAHFTANESQPVFLLVL